MNRRRFLSLIGLAPLAVTGPAPAAAGERIFPAATVCTINASALDAKSVQQFFESNGAQFAHILATRKPTLL